jgi:hypothetical protein
MILRRVIGLLCLGGAVIAGSWWWDTDRIMTPLYAEVTMPIDKTISLAFSSDLKISEETYDINLYFDNKKYSLITCDNIESLGIKWSISTSDTVRSWEDLPTIDRDSCHSYDDLTSVNFPAPSFKANANYYLYLSRSNRSQNKGEIKCIVAIQHSMGIATHYLFMKKGLAELLGGGLSLVSLSCLAVSENKNFRFDRFG